MLNTFYVVHSKNNESVIRQTFNYLTEAIEYAKGNDEGKRDQTYVEAVTADFDDYFGIDEYDKKVVWSYDDEDDVTDDVTVSDAEVDLSEPDLESLVEKNNVLRNGDTIEDTSDVKLPDNAVVKCKKYNIVAHCEDEKPVDCNMEKEVLPKRLTEESVSYYNFDEYVIEKSSILNYYPNKHQVERYINKAKAVEIAEANKGNAVEVIIYEAYGIDTLSAYTGEPEYRKGGLNPVKICYNSVENPEVEKILVQKGLLIEDLKEAKNITGRTSKYNCERYETRIAEGYVIIVERDTLHSNYPENVDDYKMQQDRGNLIYKSDFALRDTTKKSMNNESLTEGYQDEADKAIKEVVKRAVLSVDDKGEFDLDAVIDEAIDAELIYSDDIIALARKYDVLGSDDELLGKMYDQVFADVKSEVVKELRKRDLDVDESLNEDLNRAAYKYVNLEELKHYLDYVKGAWERYYANSDKKYMHDLVKKINKLSKEIDKILKNKPEDTPVIDDEYEDEDKDFGESLVEALNQSEKDELILSLNELKDDRLDKYAAEGYDVNKMSDEEIYDLDDGDRLIEAIDIIIGIISSNYSDEQADNNFYDDESEDELTEYLSKGLNESKLNESPVEDRIEEIKLIAKQRPLTDDEVKEFAELLRQKNN